MCLLTRELHVAAAHGDHAHYLPALAVHPQHGGGEVPACVQTHQNEPCTWQTGLPALCIAEAKLREKLLYSGISLNLARNVIERICQIGRTANLITGSPFVGGPVERLN